MFEPAVSEQDIGHIVAGNRVIAILDACRELRIPTRVSVTFRRQIGSEESNGMPGVHRTDAAHSTGHVEQGIISP
jgi:hypothetical protein